MRGKIISYKKTSGFTLVEMLVTMSIFITALTILSAIFLLTNKSQRKTQALQEVQTDARYAMEVLSQQVRRGNIDYDYYGGSIDSNPQTILALRDPSNNQILFRFDAGSRGRLQISQDGGGIWTDITPQNLSLQSLYFYLSPSANPFANQPLNNQQPLVTINLASKSVTVDGQDIATTYLQTTVSSRQYSR